MYFLITDEAGRPDPACPIFIHLGDALIACRARNAAGAIATIRRRLIKKDR